MTITCKDCGKEFKYKSEFDRHAKVRSCIKKDIYTCPKCNYTTTKRWLMERHNNMKTDCSKRKKNINDKLKELESKLKDYDAKIKKSIKQAKRPINYNFIVANFNDAINIEDCLAMENITKDIMDKCKKMPLKDGSTFVLNSLCDIDPKIRPFHCTDLSRQNFIVRSEDQWNVDAKGEKIKSHMTPIVSGVYNEVYKDKMLTVNNNIDERIQLMDTMSKELLSDNINKSCTNSIKQSAGNYATKNIESDNQLLNGVIDIDDIDDEF